MNRLVSAEYAEAIGDALVTLPPGMRDRLRGVDFLTGTDPVFAGLHDFEGESGGAWLGRSPRETWHYCPAEGASDGRSTVVMPTMRQQWSHEFDWYRRGSLLHEMGHALHDSVPDVVAVAIGGYARINEREAFAESFMAWLTWDRGVVRLTQWHWDNDPRLYMADLPTRALFEALA